MADAGLPRPNELVRIESRSRVVKQSERAQQGENKERREGRRLHDHMREVSGSGWHGGARDGSSPYFPD